MAQINIPRPNISPWFRSTTTTTGTTTGPTLTGLNTEAPIWPTVTMAPTINWPAPGGEDMTAAIAYDQITRQIIAATQLSPEFMGLGATTMPREMLEGTFGTIPGPTMRVPPRRDRPVYRTPRDPLANIQGKYQVLFIKDEGGKINHASQTRTRRFREVFRRAMMQDFRELHTIFPMNSMVYDLPSIPTLDDLDDLSLSPVRHRTPSFSFERLNGWSQLLHVNRNPALIFVAIANSIPHLGETLEIHLKEILATNNANDEKLKRLFLRHMGFHCIRERNMLKISSGKEVVFLKRKQNYKFSNQTTIEHADFTQLVTNEFTRIGIIVTEKK
jgi:hypothetical protein